MESHSPSTISAQLQGLTEPHSGQWYKWRGPGRAGDCALLTCHFPSECHWTPYTSSPVPEVPVCVWVASSRYTPSRLPHTLNCILSLQLLWGRCRRSCLTSKWPAEESLEAWDLPLEVWRGQGEGSLGPSPSPRQVAWGLSCPRAWALHLWTIPDSPCFYGLWD